MNKFYIALCAISVVASLNATEVVETETTQRRVYGRQQEYRKNNGPVEGALNLTGDTITGVGNVFKRLGGN